ncbi:MAG: class I SAM-dependent methyltransferase [Acidimicrobiia bacterium]
MPDAAGHYFDPAPGAASRPATVRLTLPDVTLELATDRGVFSADRVDPGTKYLLLDAPAPPETGTFVDLGCGYGPIACTLARRAPGATVWAVDVNERARALCRANAEALGLANVVVAAPDEAPEDLSIDRLWSNPPIRIGKAALHDLLGTWLGRLAPAGSAVLVVQKHLGADSLQRWLEGEGWRAVRLGSRSGYRLLEVTRA